MHTINTHIKMYEYWSPLSVPGRAFDSHSLGHRAARRETEACERKPLGCWRRTHAATYCRTHCGRPCPHRRTTSAPGAVRDRDGTPAQKQVGALGWCVCVYKNCSGIGHPQVDTEREWEEKKTEQDHNQSRHKIGRCRWAQRAIACVCVCGYSWQR